MVNYKLETFKQVSNLMIEASRMILTLVAKGICLRTLSHFIATF